MHSARTARQSARPRRRAARGASAATRGADATFTYLRGLAFPLPSLRRRADLPHARGLSPYEENAVDLTFWIPALAALGLGTLGLMFAFIVACDRV